MKSVVFSGSVRNYPAMELWATLLREHGVTIQLPRVTISHSDFEAMSTADQRRQKQAFITDHNQRIDRSDVLFVFNPDGYVGNSVTLEIGYALAQHKSIYAMQADEELGRDVVYAGHCATPAALLAVLE
jgi:nucleoside 2-deoxyribosyltransferase